MNGMYPYALIISVTFHGSFFSICSKNIMKVMSSVKVTALTNRSTQKLRNWTRFPGRTKGLVVERRDTQRQMQELSGREDMPPRRHEIGATEQDQ